MLKTAMISATALLLSSIAVPANTATPNRIDNLTRTAVTNDYEACMLNAGCVFVSPSETSPGFWECPNPRLAMNCYEPADPGVP
ncbi:hypothetical protein [Brevundimonas sp. M20]|uniref:hypothetical protein n=1 Tax=Brevundimonas sp. M20 TaxID=2591463 RepID=UPI0011469C5A|nr:hypothetical protein [Brevundimonas sp. M20]QDH74578.1 hypothetical protein FKQ52_14870 [Brevundimonas sp. M20]